MPSEERPDAVPRLERLVPPTHRFTTPHGLPIAYADEGEGEPLLMVMGISLHLVHWPPSLCTALRSAGFRLIRFDNRDCGASAKLDHLAPPGPTDLFWGRGAPYSLDDMAKDGLALMDRLSLARVHLCGISMGGMIAQLMALAEPERFKSLTLMMTTDGGAYLPTLTGLQTFFGRPATSRQGVADRFLANQRRLAGFGAPPLGGESEILDLGRLIYDRSGGLPQPAWFARQFAAVRTARPRRRRLWRLQVPTRVIHGALDPLVPVRAGVDLARAIPQADLQIVAQLGHVMPRWCRPQLAALIAEHAMAHRA